MPNGNIYANINIGIDTDTQYIFDLLILWKTTRSHTGDKWIAISVWNYVEMKLLTRNHSR